MFENLTEKELLKEIERLTQGHGVTPLHDQTMISHDGAQVNFTNAEYALVALCQALVKLKKGKKRGYKPGKYEPVVIAIAVEVLCKKYGLRQVDAIPFVEKFTEDQARPIRAEQIKTYHSKYHTHPTFLWFTDEILNKYPASLREAMPDDPESTARLILHNIKNDKLEMPHEPGTGKIKILS